MRGDIEENMESAANERLTSATGQPLVLSDPVLRDLLSLSKPGTITLLLLGTAASAFLAGAKLHHAAALAWTITGGTFAAASAGAFNCIFDRDIDALMERTKKRPLPAGRISVGEALLFGVSTGLLGFLILALKANLLCLSVILGGHVFYAVVYTLLLKRRTVQNIVVGGLAGAVPPLAGWAAIHNAIGLTPMLLGLLIFAWTPPHFWALAIYRAEDYRRAKIPLLPARDPQAAGRWIMIYVSALVPINLLVVLTHPLLGVFSLAGIGCCSLFFWLSALQFTKAVEAEKLEKARHFFRSSIIYLTTVFIVLIGDVLCF